MKRFTDAQIEQLRGRYARMSQCGPLQRSTIRAIFHQCEDEAVQQLAEAGIEHISRMATSEWYQRQARLLEAARGKHRGGRSSTSGGTFSVV